MSSCDNSECRLLIETLADVMRSGPLWRGLNTLFQTSRVQAIDQPLCGGEKSGPVEARHEDQMTVSAYVDGVRAS